MIRAFEVQDYVVWAELVQETFSFANTSVASLQHEDATWDPKYVREKFILAHPSQAKPVGLMGYKHDPYMYHPQHFSLIIIIHPDFRRRGLGHQAYQYALEKLAPYEPMNLYAFTDTAYQDSLSFLHKRGFKEVIRITDQALTLSELDLALLAPLLAKGDKANVDIRSDTELASEPDHLKKLFQLIVKTNADSPSPEALTLEEFTLEDFISRRDHDPNRLADGYFIAVDRSTGAYVGVSSMQRGTQSDEIVTGFTGVVRAYRGRGIAQALKAKGLYYAKASGATTLTTGNAEGNTAMLAINRKVGFKPLRTVADFKKEL